REPTLDQALRQRVDERARRRVGQLAPSAAAVALGQEQSPRIALDRRTEEVRQARIAGCQGLARAAEQSSAVARLADDARACIGKGAQRRGSGHLASSPPAPGAGVAPAAIGGLAWPGAGAPGGRLEAS